MRALVLEEFGDRLRVRERRLPPPPPGWVDVEVISCGLGLTIEHARVGRLGGTTPRVLGHELSGRVLGDGEAYERGELVTASFYLLCGSCPQCVQGRDNLCERIGGFIGGTIDGALAEVVQVPERNLVRVPPGVRPEDAGVIADALATPYHLLTQRLALLPGAPVCVVGAGGGLGVHVVALARLMGARTVAVELDEAKRQRLESDGHADLVIDAAGDWSAEVLDGLGPMAVCVDTVGSEATLRSAAQCLGRRGTLVALGLHADASVSVPVADLITSELSVVGTRYATRADIAGALDLVAAGLVAPVIGARFGFDEVDEAFRAVQAGAVFGRVVVDVAA